MTTERHLVHQIIARAKGFVQQGHTTGVLARDREGKDTDPNDHFACQWCAIGAVFRAIQVITGHRYGEDRDAFMAVKTQVMHHLYPLLPPHMGIDQLNDRLGLPAVIDLFARALRTDVASA